MRMLIFMLALLMCSCSLKRKLKESSRIGVKQNLQVQRNNVAKATAQTYQADSGSRSYVNQLKIYPRGEIRMSKDGFIGTVDSLIWYGAKQQSNNTQRITTASREQLLTEQVDRTGSYVNETSKKELTKVGTSFWWLVAGVVLMLTLFFLYKRFVE